jgi:hypothetical protein
MIPSTCVAYQLLLGYGEWVDVGDWFASFCVALGAQSACDASMKPQKSKGKSRQKKNKKLRTVERRPENVPREELADASEQPELDSENRASKVRFRSLGCMYLQAK